MATFLVLWHTNRPHTHDHPYITSILIKYYNSFKGYAHQFWSNNAWNLRCWNNFTHFMTLVNVSIYCRWFLCLMAGLSGRIFRKRTNFLQNKLYPVRHILTCQSHCKCHSYVCTFRKNGIIIFRELPGG